MVASYTLDTSNLLRVREEGGPAADTFVKGVASVWAAARMLRGAAALILQGADRTVVAARSMIIDGKANLNVGLLMPSLRQMPKTIKTDLPQLQRFAGRYHRIVWDILERMNRVEADRVMALKFDDHLVQVHVGRDGLSFLSGCATVEALLQHIRHAVEHASPVHYSLADHPGGKVGQTYPLVSLLKHTEPDDRSLDLGLDGWPEKIPQQSSFTETAALVGFAQRLRAMPTLNELRATVLDEKSRVMLSGIPVTTGVRITLSAVYHAND